MYFEGIGNEIADRPGMSLKGKEVADYYLGKQDTDRVGSLVLMLDFPGGAEGKASACNAESWV